MATSIMLMVFALALALVTVLVTHAGSSPAPARKAKHAGQPESKRSERVLQRLSTLPPLNTH